MVADRLSLIIHQALSQNPTFTRCRFLRATKKCLENAIKECKEFTCVNTMLISEIATRYLQEVLLD